MSQNKCQYNYPDCENFPDKCYLCTRRGLHYKQIKIKRHGIKRGPKKSKRLGSEFEYYNSVNNNKILNGTVSRQTPNSGAGHIKGDEEIDGLVQITEELKNQDKMTSKGEKTFTIHKEWLEKLKQESIDARKEFWYLKFAFGTDYKNSYVILDIDTLMSLIYTLSEDRKKFNKLNNNIHLLEERLEQLKKENDK